MAQFASMPEAESTAHALIASVVKDRFNHHLQNRNYVIMLKSGLDDGGKRATLAFSAACSARAMDLKTQVFLIGDGSHWAYEASTEVIRRRDSRPWRIWCKTIWNWAGRSSSARHATVCAHSPWTGKIGLCESARVSKPGD